MGKRACLYERMARHGRETHSPQEAEAATAAMMDADARDARDGGGQQGLHRHLRWHGGKRKGERHG